MAPFSLPASTISRISSSLTWSSASLGSMPMSRSTVLVEKERNHTMGANRVEMKLTRPEIPRASSSDFFMAIRLGTSSPKIKVK